MLTSYQIGAAKVDSRRSQNQDSFVKENIEKFKSADQKRADQYAKEQADAQADADALAKSNEALDKDAADVALVANGTAASVTPIWKKWWFWTGVAGVAGVIYIAKRK